MTIAPENFPRQADLFENLPEEPAHKAKGPAKKAARPDPDILLCSRVSDATKPKLEKLLSETENYRLLERVPLTRNDFPEPPYYLAEPAGDELPVVFLDLETTGLIYDEDPITELGMVKARYSPSRKQLTAIDAVFSEYDDPGKKIPPEATKLTGITDEMVRGKHINEQDVLAFLKDASLIVSHNASFDRPRFEKRFKGFGNYLWACSLNDIEWKKNFGMDVRKQDIILMRSGYFYEAHRASIDCLALAWMLFTVDGAFAELFENTKKNYLIVHAFGAPIEIKEKLKSRGYKWNNGTSGFKKHWWKETREDLLAEEKKFLDSLYPNGSRLARYSPEDTIDRFKQP